MLRCTNTVPLSFPLPSHLSESERESANEREREKGGERERVALLPPAIASVRERESERESANERE